MIPYGIEIADALGAMVVRHKENKGYGAAIRTCFETAKEITNPDMGAGSEILTQVKNYNLKVVEIPITVRYDIGGALAKNPKEVE